MTAIYKRELKSYLTSMVGYLFIFLSLYWQVFIFLHISFQQHILNLNIH